MLYHDDIVPYMAVMLIETDYRSLEVNEISLLMGRVRWVEDLNFNYLNG